MLVVETIAKIRRAYFGQAKPIKEICRELGISRKVVRKVIRTGATEFRYQREIQPLPKIGPWRDRLDEVLRANEGKPARERLTLIRLFEALRGLGYDGSYDAVRRYARGWNKERGAATAEAYMPLSFAPGEAYQFDWSHEVVLIDGTTVTIKAAHVRLCVDADQWSCRYQRPALPKGAGFWRVLQKVPAPRQEYRRGSRIWHDVAVFQTRDRLTSLGGRGRKMPDYLGMFEAGGGLFDDRKV